MLMRDQLDLNRSLIDLLRRSEEVMVKIRLSEAQVASRIAVEERKEENNN
jgi:hypothetical protein